MNARPIGVFDSGVGGLSILRELKKILPHENFVFLGDQLHVPYGEKTKKQLVDLDIRVAKHLQKNYDIKLLVVACNTATCYGIDEIRKDFLFPVIGTVPAVKPAGEKTRSGSIVVISTPATSKSKMLAGLIKDFCKGVNVLNIGGQGLENAVERGDINSQKVKDLIKKYLGAVKYSPADHVVLGCTHYPFLKKTIEKVVGPKVKLVDSGFAISKNTKAHLKKFRLENKSKKKGETIYLTTGSAQKFSRVASRLLSKKITAKKVKI